MQFDRALVVATLLISASALHAKAPQPHRMVLTVTPYVWVPKIAGNVSLGPLSVSVRTTATDIADGFKAGGMGGMKLEDGRHFLYAEAIWVDYHNTSFQPFFNQNLTSKVRYFEGGVGLKRAVKLGHKTILNVAPYVGVQHLYIGSFVTGSLITKTANGDWTNPAAGVLVDLPLSRRFTLNAKINGAGFGVTDTDYVNGSIQVSFQATKRLTLSTGYRYAHGKFDSAHELAIDIHGSGPTLGVSYAFPIN